MSLLWTIPICVAFLAAPTTDEDAYRQLPRRLVKEPAYEGSPRYALLAFGPEGREHLWVVADDRHLYADVDGSGDLTRPGHRFASEKDELGQPRFRVPLIERGGHRYTDLWVSAAPAKDAEFLLGDWPAYREFLRLHPGYRIWSVSVEVPLPPGRRNIYKDEPMVRDRQFVTGYDADGVLLLGKSPADAPVLHFAGPLRLSFQENCKLTQGSAEELTVRLGTAGKGAGSFAAFRYYFLPVSAKPRLGITYKLRGGGTRREELVLEDRC
jgi:hypothetical protein